MGCPGEIWGQGEAVQGKLKEMVSSSKTGIVRESQRRHSMAQPFRNQEA